MSNQDSQTLFRTDRSSLVLHPLDNDWCQKMILLSQTIDGLLTHHPEVVMYGRVCHMQRSVGFFSDESIGYRFSGQLAASQPLFPELKELLQYVNERFDARFNGILVNKYESGEEYISKHSDDESALDPTAGVLVISVGAVRTFRIRNKGNNNIVINVPTSVDHILQMCGDFQKEFTHEIPVEKRVEGARFSFTFRHHTQ